MLRWFEVSARDWVWGLGACAVAACSSKPALPPGLADFDGGILYDTGSPGSGGGNGTCDAPPGAPSPDALGLCGNMFLDVTAAAPNLYFVIDRSGSMSDYVDGRQKYAAVTAAAVAL